jgi:iron complex outermembrane receptor protein
MDAYEYLGNSNLKSETNYQTDLRVEKNWKNVTVYGDVFYSYLTNYISAKLDTNIAKKFMPCKPPKGTKVFTNIDKAFMSGFEAGVNVNFLKHFSYSFGAAYTYAQNITWDEPLPEIPPFTINTYLAYKTEKVNARLHARIASDQDRVSTSFMESTTPGFTVMDFHFVYSPWEFLDINFAVTNLFDVNYVEHLSRVYKNMGPNTGSLYYEPGRSINAGLRFKF